MRKKPGIEGVIVSVISAVTLAMTVASLVAMVPEMLGKNAPAAARVLPSAPMPTAIAPSASTSTSPTSPSAPSAPSAASNPPASPVRLCALSPAERHAPGVGAGIGARCHAGAVPPAAVEPRSAPGHPAASCSRPG